MDGFAEIFGLGIGAGQAGFEELAGFLFHRTAVAGGADTQPPLSVLGESSDCDAGYDCYDITAIIDCTEEVATS